MGVIEAGGVMLAMNVEDFGNGGKFEPAEPFVFAGLEVVLVAWES